MKCYAEVSREQWGDERAAGSEQKQKQDAGCTHVRRCHEATVSCANNVSLPLRSTAAQACIRVRASKHVGRLRFLQSGLQKPSRTCAHLEPRCRGQAATPQLSVCYLLFGFLRENAMLTSAHCNIQRLPRRLSLYCALEGLQLGSSMPALTRCSPLK